ncbi:MAG: polysaccharide deacetylase family protein [Opitutaceae bacterium]
MARSTFLILLLCKAAAITLALLGCWRLAALVYFGPDGWVLYHLFVPSAQGLCRSFTRFETARNEIWLTIDDGPDPVDTPQILDLLDQHQARATFFVIGERAVRYPDLVNDIVRRGHQIGHHTQTHPLATFWCASPRRLRAELDRVIDGLRPAGIRPHWFRPPVGIKHFLLPAALAARDLQCVGWSVRSGDVLSREPGSVVARVMRQLRPGVIVLVHEGPSMPPAVRVKAIALLLGKLAGRNFRCVLPDVAQLR